MKTKILFSYLIFLFFCFMGNVNLYSQGTSRGIVRGNISGSDTKRGLPYAVVMIVGTTNGASTDDGGNYIIRNVNAGKQQIKISYIGYETKTVNIVVESDKTTEINVVMEITFVKGEEVVISAQRVGQQDAINEQINSDVIKNVVAEDRLQENPDANIAEAIGRLPGVSLIRAGGEGVSVVIRGLDPSYSQILLDGIPLPSPDIYGISLYSIQGAEVFKTITPDMEGDAPAGTINLKLNQAPSGAKYSLMVDGGYNNLNDYWKNYTVAGNFSNRFFDDKLGVMLSLNLESVNRSAQTLGADFVTKSIAPPGQLAPLYASGISLNDQKRINERGGATLLLDYNLSSNTSLSLSNFYSHFNENLTGVSKSYDLTTGFLDMGISNSPHNFSETYISSLKAIHKFQSFELDEGVAFTQLHQDAPDQRSWSFGSLSPMLTKYGDNATQRLPLNQILAFSSADADASLKEFQLGTMSYSATDNIEQNIDAYINSKIPFNIGDYISTYIKIGSEYKKYSQDSHNSSQYAQINQINNFLSIMEPYFPWATSATTPNRLSLVGLNDYKLNGFLKGQYNFGWYPRIDRLKQLFDWWNSWSRSNDYTTLVPGWPIKGEPGFIPDWNTTLMNTHKFSGDYYAGYIMGELNLGDIIIFTPGVRYEEVRDKMNGWELSFVPNQNNVWQNFGIAHDSTHSDNYWLPMVNIKTKPTKWLQTLFSFTQTLKRPAVGDLIPNVYYYNGGGSLFYNSGNPGLKPEFWTSYDLQVAIFGNEIGLVSIGGFYKTVKNMIWTPSIWRTAGNPWPFGLDLSRYFTDNSTVSVSMPQNFNYLVNLKGLEFEMQSSLWYLPEPFNHITVNANFTLINSTTTSQYTKTRSTQVGVDSRGRPIYKLITIDSVYAGPMLNQPKSIANFSLGYNYMGFNLWLSYQYTGTMITSFPNLTEFEENKSKFARWDLQVSQKLPIDGLEVLFNFANINNPIENQNYLADPRSAYSQNYGWTMDLGIRYRL